MAARVAVRDDPRYRRWVVATTVGELGGFAIPAVAGAAVTAAGAGQGVAVALLVLAGAGEGAVLGWAQSRMLRRELPRLRPGDWVRATAAGAALAWVVGMLPSTFGERLAGLPAPVLAALGLVAGVLLLATIGVAQWLVLRRHVDRAWTWVPANALGWVAGLVVVFAVLGVAPGGSPVLVALFGVAGGLGMGLTVALVTGLVLVRLLDGAGMPAATGGGRPAGAGGWPARPGRGRRPRPHPRAGP